jgi:hypothetical protein
MPEREAGCLFMEFSDQEQMTQVVSVFDEGSLDRNA